MRALSLEIVSQIIAMSGEPGLRNLRITQYYGDLSRAIATTVSGENANWCTFATWASKAAGRFIRLAGLEGYVRTALHQSDAAGGGREIFPEKLVRPDIWDDLVVDAARSIASDVSAAVAAGNLTVFAELAPLFSEMIPALQQAKRGGHAAFVGVVESLKRGPVSQGGQELLRQALNDYLSATFETNPRQKAELMLRANAQVGAHEQIRLQTYIAKALTAPLGNAVAALVHRERGGPARDADTHGLDAMLDLLLHPYEDALEQLWLQVSTRYLMTLELPNGTLHLGRDLPNAPGQPIFPAALVELQDSNLLRILRIYRADGISSRGSGAYEWSNLSDRMRYILELFRSRQQDACLFEPPFNSIASDLIKRGIVPLVGV